LTKKIDLLFDKNIKKNSLLKKKGLTALFAP